MRYNLRFAIPVAILLVALGSGVLISTTINWSIGQELGGPVNFAYGYSSGDIAGGFLVFLGLCQLVWGPLLVQAVKERATLMGLISVIMMALCLFLSAFAGLAWQNAHSDMSERRSSASLDDWQSSTKTIKLNYNDAVRARDVDVIQADIDMILYRSVLSRGKRQTLKILTGACTKPTYKTRGACSSYHKLRAELARANADARRDTATQTARVSRDSAVHVDVRKYYEIFDQLFPGQPGQADKHLQDQKLYRMLAVQLAMDLSITVMPILIAWLWPKLSPEPPKLHARLGSFERGAPEFSDEPPTLTVIKGGRDKGEHLRQFIRETTPRGWHKPDEFVAALNVWCEQRGLNRFQIREVGQQWESIGGARRRIYKRRAGGGTSPRLLWGLHDLKAVAA